MICSFIKLNIMLKLGQKVRFNQNGLNSYGGQANIWANKIGIVIKANINRYDTVYVDFGIHNKYYNRTHAQCGESNFDLVNNTVYPDE